MPKGWKAGEVALTQEMIRRGEVKNTEKLSARQLLQRAGFVRHKSRKQIQNIFKRYFHGTTIAQLILVYEHGGSWEKRRSPKPPDASDGRLLANAASQAARYARKQHRPTWAEANDDSFLRSYEWRRVRMLVLKKYGSRCQCCGASAIDGVVIHVDHIKPRKIFPQLALELSNLQVLCEVCNQGKGNWDMTDWRPDEQIDTEHAAHLRDILNDERGL